MRRGWIKREKEEKKKKKEKKEEKEGDNIPFPPWLKRRSVTGRQS